MSLNLSKEQGKVILKELKKKGIEIGAILEGKDGTIYTVVGLMGIILDVFVGVITKDNKSVTLLDIKALKEVCKVGKRELTKEERHRYKGYIVEYNEVLTHLKLLLWVREGTLLRPYDSCHELVLQMNPLVVYLLGDKEIPSEKELKRFLLSNSKDVIEHTISSIELKESFYLRNTKIIKQYDRDFIKGYAMKLKMLYGDFITYD